MILTAMNEWSKDRNLTWGSIKVKLVRSNSENCLFYINIWLLP